MYIELWSIVALSLLLFFLLVRLFLEAQARRLVTLSAKAEIVNLIAISDEYCRTINMLLSEERGILDQLDLSMQEIQVQAHKAGGISKSSWLVANIVSDNEREKCNAIGSAFHAFK